MRVDLRSSSWLFGRAALAAALLSGCGAPDEPLSRSTAPLEYVLKQNPKPLVPKAVQPYDEFGNAIGVSSRWAAVGSPGHDFHLAPPLGPDDTGAATVFERKQGNVWEESVTLGPQESWPEANFGVSVAVTDELVALGAPAADPIGDGSFTTGAVAVFSYHDGAWDPAPHFLKDPNQAVDRYFGSAVAADQHTVLVGAPGADQAIAFPRTSVGFGEPVVLDLPLPTADIGFFGFALALDDPFAFVGAPFYDEEGQPDEDRGAVFVFKRTGSAWAPQGQLDRNIVNAGDQFGTAIAAGNGLVVGTAYGDASLLFYRREEGSRFSNPIRKAAEHLASPSAFGWSLALGRRSSVWVGAFRDVENDGTVFPFLPDRDSWKEEDGLSFPGGGRFGYSIASASGAVMVGAPDADDHGAVYVIETSDGSTCTDDEDCFSTHCVAGICCNSSCDKPCYSCLSEEKASGSADGTCEPRRAGSLPAAEGCVDRGPQGCGTNGRCDGQGACDTYPAGTQCGEPFCSGNNVIGAALCDAEGNCASPAPTSCDNYSCSDGACQKSCASDQDCQTAFYCGEGRCRPQLGLGASCSLSSACRAGFCADGVCCDRACDGQCEACAEPGSAGSCSPLPAGTPPRAAAASSAEPTQACAQLFCDGVDGSAPSLLADPSVVCSPAGCVDGTEVGEGRCDGAGRCEVTAKRECGAYACESADRRTGRPSQCQTSCETVSDCALDFYCTTDHECLPIEPARHESRGCSVSATGGPADSACIRLAISAIALLGLRRRRPTTRNSPRDDSHPLH